MTQKYDKEFKINAVKVYLSNNKSIEKIAQDLGVSRSSLGPGLSNIDVKETRVFLAVAM